MLNREPSEQNALLAALGPTPECPPLEELESFAAGEEPAATVLAGHLRSCAYCKTELDLLQTFLAGQSSSSSQEVNKVAELLRQRSRKIIREVLRTSAEPPWWRAAFTVRRLAYASLAMAAVFLMTGAIVFFRSVTYRPQLEAANRGGQEVLRAGSFAVISPAGDLQTGPKEIRWERVPQAARYRVSLLEVDRSEMWRAETTEDHVELPASIQARIVPAKTLFLEVMALDSAGTKVGDTGLVRFRLLRGAAAR
jgi:hypothetical protein